MAGCHFSSLTRSPTGKLVSQPESEPRNDPGLAARSGPSAPLRPTPECCQCTAKPRSRLRLLSGLPAWPADPVSGPAHRRGQNPSLSSESLQVTDSKKL